MQLPRSLGLLLLVRGRLLRQGPATIATGVEPDVLPNAHPAEWMACAANDVCPLLDTVPHDCFEPEGEMYVHPQCFDLSCQAIACVAGKATPEAPAPPTAAEVCAPVKAEIWSRAEQRGHSPDVFLEECQAGTFTCLMNCPDIHALLVDDRALDRCHGGPSSREYCVKWLSRMQDCVAENGICGASFFSKLPGITAALTSAIEAEAAAESLAGAYAVDNATANATANASASAANASAAAAVSLANLEELRNLTRQMDAVVRSAQEAFETTFMNGACHPACEPGEECVHNKCIYRPAQTRYTASGRSDGIGGVHARPQWWKDFADDRPNHPQRDHWNPAVAAGREPHRFGGF